MKRQSAFKWAEEKGLVVLSFTKAFTMEEYHDKLIGYDEFLNKISLCELRKPEVKSRREAAKYLSTLGKKCQKHI